MEKKLPQYDFKSLSAYDFELLCRDILQAELKVRLESYKPGKDGGVDLRGYETNNKELIVQCKHYANSTFNDLIRKIKCEEVEKVKKINPSTYILITSLNLSKSNKNKIFQLLPEFFKTEANIFGQEDINNILGRHPQIEKQHFKLWLTSITILEQVLHSGIINRSGAKIRDIQEKLKLYVQNDSYQKANEILEQYKYLIISGIAGIGKTTLADILSYSHLGQGYEFIEITENIEEAWKLLNPEEKQLFYYDDFLGQTSLSEKLGKNEGQSIISFIKEIQKSKNKRFILTTREYLLKQAQSANERLNDKSIEIVKCTVSLGDYSHVIRAKILYNHLYFSDIPDSYKTELLKERFYKKIIEHRNFNPRIIEAMVNSITINSIKQHEYPNAFLDNLDKPSKIWDFAFNNQISESSRHLLSVMLTLSFGSTLEHAKNVFVSRTSYSEADFRRSIKELDGCFVKTQKYHSYIGGVYVTGEMTVGFHNPSIVDYLQDYILETGEFLENLITKSNYFSEILKLWGAPFSKETPIRLAIIKKPAALVSIVEKLLFYPIRGASKVIDTYYEERMLLLLDVYNEIKSENIKSLLLKITNTLESDNVGDGEKLLSFIDKSKCLLCFSEEELECLIQPAKRVLIAECIEQKSSIGVFKNLIEFLNENSSYVSKEELQLIEDNFFNYSGYDDEICDLNSTEELREYLEKVTEIANYWQYDISDIENTITNKITEIVKDEERRAEEQSEYWADNEKSSSNNRAEAEREIERMFSSEIICDLR